MTSIRASAFPARPTRRRRGPNALMGPVAVAPMRTRHVLGDRRWPMRQSAAQVRGDALAAQENLDGLLVDPCLDLLTYEAMGNTVVMFGNLDVIIEIDPTALPPSAYS